MINWGETTRYTIQLTLITIQGHQNKNIEQYECLDVQCIWTKGSGLQYSNMIIEEIKTIVVITMKDTYKS